MKNNLFITGGSDFHRSGKQRLGYGVNGTVPITEEFSFINIEKEIEWELR